MNKLKFRFDVQPFCCECSLMEDALDTLSYIYAHKSESYSSIAIIANEELAEKIMKFVLGNFGANVDYIDFDKADYDDAYGIVLCLDDELHFSIEKAMGKDRYKTFDMDYIYVSSDVDKDFVRDQIEYETEIDIFKVMDDCD